MDRRRLIIVALLALGLILIAVVAFAALTGNLNNVLGNATPTALPPTPTPIPGGLGPTVEATSAPDQEFVEVVVSVQTVPRGFQFTEAELDTEFRISSEIDVNVYTRIEDVVGKFARTDIFQGETLTLDSVVPDLTAVGQEDFGPSSLIPPGFVAMAVPMDRLAGVAYALAPGDSVDILISFVLQPVDEQFQSLLPNNATFYLEDKVTTTDEAGNETEQTIRVPYTLAPYGRFEELPTGDLAHVSPSEDVSRGVHISFLIQNAKVIEVGHYIPPLPAQPPTPTPDPNAESSEDFEGGQPQPEQNVTQNVQDALNSVTQPPYNFTVLVALPPQQQIFLKHAVETDSVIDFALRGVGDGELYSVENVTLDYIVERFNVEIPPNFTYVIETAPGVFEGYRNDSEIIIALTPEAPSTGTGGEGNGN